MSQSITWLGNTYTDVPYIELPKTGTGTARFDDATVTTASASDVASGKIFLASNGTITTGTASGGGGSSWTKVGDTKELAVNTTSTSAGSAGTISIGSACYTKDKIIYVRVRDKEGPRNGYFYGSDAYFMNYQKANGATSTLSVAAVEYYRYNNGAYTGAQGAYGVWGYSISNSGTLTIRRRYNSSNTLTINSTYLIDVYTLDPPLALFG